MELTSTLDNVVIKEAKDEDVLQIYLIEKENFKFHWSRDFILFNIRLSDKIKKFYVCKIYNNVIGYVVCWLSNDTAHILNISVKKEYQNKGIGSRLLLYLFNELISLNIKIVILEVRVSNYKAISFYKKFGFNEVETKKKFYPDGEDALLMIKNL